MFPGLGPTLELMDKGRKELIKLEKEVESQRSGRTDDPSARLASLEMEERSIDAAAEMRGQALELHEGKFSGRDIGPSAEQAAKAPGLLGEGSSKAKLGPGVDLSIRLDFGLDLGGGKSGGKKAGDTDAERLDPEEDVDKRFADGDDRLATLLAPDFGGDPDDRSDEDGTGASASRPSLSGGDSGVDDTRFGATALTPGRAPSALAAVFIGDAMGRRDDHG